MSNPRDGMKYFMPLTKGHPNDGPTKSVFSVPQVQYSPQTEAVVKNLMRESRLTFTQKHVFETILRNGQSLPEHPSQMVHSKMRQAYNQQRHKNKAYRMGIPILEDEIKCRPGFKNHIIMNAVLGGKRTLDTIQASGDLEPLQPPKSCIPAGNDAEKDRLAHKMAFGKDKDPEKPVPKAKNMQNPGADKKETVDDLKQRRFEELIDEIQDRMQFLLTMDRANKGKDYRSCIFSQISEKLQEIRQISPEKEKDVRKCLQLEKLDKRYSSSYSNESPITKFFDEKRH